MTPETDFRVGAPSQARGFILVGVTMFVIVLTILGLSLFSLSGFEAQFLNDSMERQQAFYSASGGIERAKWVLLRPNAKLQDVKNNLPLDGVVYAAATQAPSGQTWMAADSAG
jgi:Tfp pilus assembly protein PilX